MAVNIIRKFLMKKLMKPNAEGIMKIPEKGRIDFKIYENVNNSQRKKNHRKNSLSKRIKTKRTKSKK